MRDEVLRNRAVAIAREACHVGRRAGRAAVDTLVWQRKHIDDRMGRGILTESRSRLTSSSVEKDVSDSEPANQKTRFSEWTRAIPYWD
jgi:hypothetical protein